MRKRMSCRDWARWLSWSERSVRWNVYRLWTSGWVNKVLLEYLPSRLFVKIFHAIVGRGRIGRVSRLSYRKKGISGRRNGRGWTCGKYAVQVLLWGVFGWRRGSRQRGLVHLRSRRLRGIFHIWAGLSSALRSNPHACLFCVWKHVLYVSSAQPARHGVPRYDVQGVKQAKANVWMRYSVMSVPILVCGGTR